MDPWRLPGRRTQNTAVSQQLIRSFALRLAPVAEELVPAVEGLAPALENLPDQEPRQQGPERRPDADKTQPRCGHEKGHHGSRPLARFRKRRRGRPGERAQQGEPGQSFQYPRRIAEAGDFADFADNEYVKKEAVWRQELNQP